MSALAPFDDDDDEPNGVGQGAEWWKINAQNGSMRLRIAIERMFRVFERRHGLEPGEAQVLLLDTGLGRLGAHR